MDISKYTVEDFVNDPGFVEWAKKIDSERSAHWEDLISRRPDKSDEVRQAKEIVLSLHFKKAPMPESDLEEVRQRVIDSIQTIAPLQPTRQPASRRLASAWMRTAAAVSALLVAGWVLAFLLSTGNMVTESTAYGEKKVLTLPDGSIITLNANSEIAYHGNWKNGDEREVTLIGEGYFVVKETHRNNEKVKFLVNAGDVTVEVVGTSFNVKQRDEEVEVTLEKGKVNLKSKAESRMALEPGELAKYSGVGNQFEKQKINTAVYTAWKDNRIVFESTPIKEITKDIKYLFGVEVQFEDKDLVSREFTGVFPTDNLDVLLTSLSKAYKLEQEREGAKIILKAKR